jgi:hypothetical protein
VNTVMNLTVQRLLQKVSATLSDLLNILTLIQKETIELHLCVNIHFTSPPLPSHSAAELITFGIRNDFVFYLLYV